MADLSDFQKKKYLHVFGKFYDLNADGCVDWKDFEVDLEKLTTALKWDIKSPQRAKAEGALKTIWEGLRKSADKNQDDQISKDEWLKMWGECAKTHKVDGPLPDWVAQYMQFMFAANDGNGDDVIDVDEYTALFTKYGLAEADCKTAFNTITDNGKISLTIGEYEKLWKEYFYSTDPKSRGNSIFGPIA